MQPPTPAATTAAPIEWRVLALAWTGGYVDAIGFLVIVGLFVAHMSGNSTGVGAALGSGDWARALRHLSPIPAFVGGVIVGVALVETRPAGRRTAALVLLLEAVVIVVVTGWHLLRAEAGPEARPLLAWAVLLASAMGVQNAVFNHFGATVVRTTYITGMLHLTATSFVRWLLGQPGAGRSALITASVYLLYVAGAISGGWAAVRWDLGALLPAPALVTLLALIEVARSAGDEEAATAGSDAVR